MDHYGENLYWAALRDYPSGITGGIPKSHIHRPGEYHYMYVLDGGGRIQIGNDVFAITPGVMYLTAPGVSHSFGDSPTTLITLELKFVLADPWLREKTAELPPMVEDTTGELRQLLERILKEAEAARPYWRKLMELRLRELLLLLLQTAQGDPGEEDPAALTLQPVLRYMQENLHKNITLEDLAAAAHLEKSYFSRKFKRVSGCSPMEYLRCLRLDKAKELLRYSDLTVTQVSEALGFQSLHHFSKAFHHFAGCSPMAYKTGKHQT